MQSRSRINWTDSRAWRYGFVIASVVLATLIRLAFRPILGWQTPYITYFMAVVLSAWVGGLESGLVATALSVLTAALFIHSRNTAFGIADFKGAATACLFALEGLAISSLGQAQLVERRRAEANAARAEASELETKQSLVDLTESELRSSTIIAVALDCIIVIDGKGNITEFNPAAEDTFGYRRDEVIGRHITEVVIPPSLRGAHVAGFAKYLATGEGPVLGKRFEITAIRSSGMEFPVELAIVPTHTNGRTAFTAYVRDISERKQAEREIRQSVARQRAFLRDVLFSVTQGHLILCDSEQDLPKLYGSCGPPISLSTSGGLCELRHAAQDASRAIEMTQERIYDLITATSEAAMNAVVHVGAGEGEVFASDDRGVVQVRVRDQGAGITLENLPHATLQKGYTTAGTLGHGIKMMLELADRVFLLTGSSGTTVVIEQDRVPALGLRLFSAE